MIWNRVRHPDARHCASPEGLQGTPFRRLDRQFVPRRQELTPAFQTLAPAIKGLGDGAQEVHFEEFINVSHSLLLAKVVSNAVSRFLHVMGGVPSEPAKTTPW